jgi:hypothetical protein
MRAYPSPAKLMSDIKNRIKKLEDNIRNPKKYYGYNQLVTIDRWRYGMAENSEEAGGVITSQEWEQYCTKELENAKNAGKYQEVKRDLEELEKRIDNGNGFIKITFVSFRVPPTTKL